MKISGDFISIGSLIGSEAGEEKTTDDFVPLMTFFFLLQVRKLPGLAYDNGANCAVQSNVLARVVIQSHYQPYNKYCRQDICCGIWILRDISLLGGK